MLTVMVSIGRNVGANPLSNDDWIAFVNATSDVIRNQNEKPELHWGTGSWDGISEESAHITVYRHYVTEGMRYAYREGLSRLARHYGQDAIALTISEPELISGGAKVNHLCDEECGDETHPRDGRITHQ
jgi:hypothetical protein